MSNLFEHCRTEISSASQRYEKPEAMQINLLFAEAKYSRCSQSAISLCQSAAGGGCVGGRRRSDAPSAWAAAGFRSSAAVEERIFRNCILAGLRPAGSHCENNLILTSGSIPHLRLGVSCKERIYHFLSPKGGAKSVRRAPTSGSDGAMRNLRCAARNDDYLLVSYFSRSPACRIALRKERKDSYAPLHSVRNDKSCHPQEEVQTNSDTGIAPCIAPQTAEKKAVSDRFSAHLPENRKIIRNFVGQSINCRARI